MASLNVLELHVTVDEKHVVDCAAFLRGEMNPGHWRLLATLAAEIVRLHEQEAAGSRLVVCQTVEEGADLSKTLRLPVLQG